MSLVSESFDSYGLMVIVYENFGPDSFRYFAVVSLCGLRSTPYTSGRGVSSLPGR